MSSTIYTETLKAIPATEFNKLVKNQLNLFVGKQEILFRIYLKKNYDANLFNAKATAKAEDADPEDCYKSKLTIYNMDTAFNVIENHPIKEHKAYLLFAVRLMLSYSNNQSLREYIDKINATSLNQKYSIIDSEFDGMKDLAKKDTYDYFRTLETDCYDRLTALVTKICPGDHNITREVYDKCIRFAFKDVMSAYTYDKASTFAFTKEHQLFSFVTGADESAIGSITSLYKIVIDSCKTTRKATGTTTKGKGKAKAKSNPVSNVDDDLVDEDNDEEVEL